MIALNTLQDAQLPQLSTVLNPAMMQLVLERALNCQVKSCQILQCRYKPSKTCLVSYALTMLGRHQEQIVSVRIYPENQSLAHYQKARATASLNQHVLHIPALEMVVWVFPHDRKIRALRDITDTERLQTEILPQVVAEGFGADWQIAALHSSIVHFVAEHTCTVKVQLDLTKAGERKSPVLFGKTYYNDHGATTFQAMQSLRQHGLHLARPLSYQPHLQTLWQAGLEGQTLNDLMTEPCFAALLSQAAAAVARLHSLGTQVTAVAHTSSNRLETLAKTASLLSLVKPDSKARMDTLASQLVETSDMRPTRPMALLHGDLHLKNFFVTTDQIALIDLDNVCLGDPLADLGSFVASLYYRQLLGELPNASELIHAFIEVYRRHVSWQFSDVELRWHVVASLLGERVSRCITRLKASHLIDELLAVATRIQAGDEP